MFCSDRVILLISHSDVRLIVVFFNDTATTDIYTYGHTLSLHDALPISACGCTTSASMHRFRHANFPTPVPARPTTSERPAFVPVSAPAPASPDFCRYGFTVGSTPRSRAIGDLR